VPTSIKVREDNWAALFIYVS